MSDQDLRRLLDLCQDVLALEDSQRGPFLDRACAGNPDLRRAVEALLAEQSDAARLPSMPAWTAQSVSPGSGIAVIEHAPATLAERSTWQRAWAPVLAVLSGWPWTVVTIATARVGIALALFLSGRARASVPAPLPIEGYAALAGTFGILGLTLVAANRRDVRAMWLGAVFLLAASSFTMPLLLASSLEGTGWSWLLYLRVDPFLPALLWRFVSAFPSPLTGRPERVARAAWWAAAAIGTAFTLVIFSYYVWPATGAAPGWRQFLVAKPGRFSLHDPLVFGSSIAAFPMLLWRAWRAHENDRRRVLLFTAAFVAGSAPLVLQTVLEAIFPSYFRFVHRPGVEVLVCIVLFGALATVPFITAYSILFDRIVDLRVALRAAAQYGLARYTILALTLVPFAALTLLAVRHRQEPLAALLNGPRPVVLGLTVCAGFVAMRLRRRWLEALDRRFFREQYDARHTLDHLATGALQATDPAGLSVRIQDAIGAALHANAILLTADERLGMLRDPRGVGEEIATNAILVNLAFALDEPMDVDPSDDRSAFRRLPGGEQRWLLNGGFRLLLTLRGRDERPIGILALTSKRSGLDYSNDDRRLLSALAASASLALENLRLRATTESSRGPAARECPRCARLTAPEATTCVCGGPLVMSSAPYLLRGVYQLDRRIGEGGMGVVYHARDLALDRSVAVKTLPRMTPAAAARLRTEARAMAAVAHPNLAVVHGIETWQGIPFLVEEFLEGGTLADRLRQGRLTVTETLDLGVTLADVLEQLHTAGLVHRDIKPGNIGFTLTGVVKLLDFGLARLVGGSGSGDADRTTVGHADHPHAGHPDASGRWEYARVGTPAYMSPEALEGQRPAPSFDLWSLAVVLYESAAGRRPFDVGTSSQGMTFAERDGPAPLSDFVDGCAGFDDYFGAALSADERQRPPDARAVKARLQELRAKCG